MQTPAEITFHNLDHSLALEATIRKRVGKLERFFDGILACRVAVEARQKRHHKGNLYTVHVTISVPGDQIVVSRNGPKNAAHADPYVALRDAFDAVDRRLEDYARRLRGEVKRHAPPMHGKVLRIFPEQGYGFVATADGQEVYFHQNSVAGQAFGKLEPGSEVRLVVAEGEGEKGPQASTVQPLGKHHIVP
jgi:ribosomal subunit interface protein